MSENILNPKIPFVWNEPNFLEGEYHYQFAFPIEPYLFSAQSIFGVVYELNSSGVNLLERLFSDTQNLKGKIVIFVKAAGETKAEDLKRLLLLKQDLPDRFDVRLQVLKTTNNIPTNVVCCFNEENSEVLLFTGAGVNFNQSDQINLFPPIANLALRCDTALQKSFTDWFNYLWLKSPVLSEKTVNIPHLIPAHGTLEAAQIWEEYLAQCQAEEENEGKISEDGVKSEEEKKPTATEELGIPKVDNAAEKIARLFTLGSQVTIDKNTRIPPLDAPIKPEWFGVESLRQFGTVKRTIQYRISVISSDALKQLDTKRKKASDLLKRLSFPLGDGVHWMPEKAFSLFEQEMNRVNEEGQQQLKAVLGSDTDAFVDTQRTKILKDANAMLQDFQPGGQLSEEHANELITDLKSRLKKASEGKFLPKVSRVNVNFKIGGSSEWESAWGQALTFLQAIAEFPRKAMTDRYFLQGLRVNEDRLIEAMNVGNDYLASEDLKINPKRQAEPELEFLKNLDDADFEPRDKCEAILNLLEGKPEKEIWARLNDTKDQKETAEKKTETAENIMTINGKENYEKEVNRNLFPS